MTNALTFGKRVFTMAVVAVTVLSSVAAGLVGMPSVARAADDYANGDLIKGSLSTVYYVYDDERFTFPSEGVFYTWYEDFDDVMEVSDSALAAIPLAGNIVVRPGTWMIKVQSDPKTYVVNRGGELHWVETEEVATDLFGEDWNMWIMDVADVFFTDYEAGVSMTEAMLTDGMLVEDDSTTYLVWDDELRAISDDGMDANRLQSRFVMSDSSVDLSDYEMGSDIDAEVASLSDSSQQASGTASSEGGLTVSLNDDSPSGQTIPRSATNVQLMAVDLEASDADVSVSNMTFDFSGVSDESVLSSVYLYWNGERLTNGKSVNSTTREVTFSGLGIDVAAGDTETIWLTADVDDSDFGTASVAFELEDEDAVTSSAESVDGDFPVEGDSNTVTSAAEVGTVTIDKTGSLSDVTLGEEEAEVARFTIAADEEDAEITSLTLNVDKADDHSAYELWQSSTKLGDGESIGDDLVLFELDEAYTILDGNTKTFKVTASIGGDPADEIHSALEETSDLTAIGGDFGFGMQVDSTGYDEDGTNCATTGDDCSFVNIIGGKLTFAFNGPSASTDLQIGGDDQSIFDFTLTSQNAATVNSFEFDLTMTDADDGTDFNFENFRIVKDDGTTLMGPEELSTIGDNTQTIVFSDEFDIAAGDSWDLSLVVDINDTGDAAEDDTITAVLDSSETEAEDTEGNDLVVGTDIIPSADLTGHDLTLNDASLEVDVAGTPSTGTVVKGSQDVDMVGFSFAAGDASDLIVTDASFTVLVEAASAGTTFVAGEEGVGDFAAQNKITSCSLYNSDGDLIDGPESVDADATMEFSGFQWTIASGETERMVVNCNLANVDLEGTPDADRYAIQLDDVTVEDADGDEITATLTETNDDDGDNPDTIINVAATGTLEVALGADSADATIIIGNSTDVEVGTFRFSATTESFYVNTLTFANGGDDDVATDVSISYEDEDGATQTATSTLSGGLVEFSNLDMYVGADDTSDVVVTIDTNNVSGTGATSGATFQLTLQADTAGELEATGVDSGELENDIDTTVDADEFELRKTKPTLSKASGSPSGSSIASLDEVLRFNIAADSHGFVTVNELTFKMVSTDGDTSAWNTCDGGDITTADFSLYNYDDLSEELEDDDAEWTLFDAAGANCGAGNVITYVNIDLTTPVEIGAGTTETFSLYVDTTGASSADDDSVRFDVPRQSELDTAATGVDSINWDDDTQGTDVDGALVKTLPITGGTLVY